MMRSQRESHYLDGAIPGIRFPRAYQSEQTLYIQPEIEVAEAGSGARVEDQKTAVCQWAGEPASGGIIPWLSANKTIILTAAAVYGGYRLLRS